MTLGEKIKKLRSEKGWSQQQFADKLEVHRKTVAFYEQDKTKPPADIIQTMAGLFEVSNDYLLEDKPGDFEGITIKDKSLIPVFQEIDKLNEQHKEVVKVVVDGLMSREKTKKNKEN